MLELGGTHVAGALVAVERTPRVLDVPRRIAIRPDASAASVLDDIVECANELAARSGAVWGAAFPGPFDYASGIAHYHDVGKFESLAGIDIAGTLLRRIVPQPRTIRFLNDAAAFVIGEWCAGAARGYDRVIGLTLGTGVGSGFLAAGRVVHSGQNVPPGGRIDRITVDGTPLEDLVSRRAMLREINAPVGVDVRDLAAAARTGDRAAAGLFDRTFRTLGAAIAPWADRFAADLIVIGGSIAAAWDLIAPPLRAGLDHPAPLVRAELTDTSAFIGAAWHARHDEPAE